MHVVYRLFMRLNISQTLIKTISKKRAFIAVVLKSILFYLFFVFGRQRKFKFITRDFSWSTPIACTHSEALTVSIHQKVMGQIKASTKRDRNEDRWSTSLSTNILYLCKRLACLPESGMTLRLFQFHLLNEKRWRRRRIRFLFQLIEFRIQHPDFFPSIVRVEDKFSREKGSVIVLKFNAGSPFRSRHASHQAIKKSVTFGKRPAIGIVFLQSALSSEAKYNSI